LKINPEAPLITMTPTTTRCHGSYNLKLACTRHRARDFTSAQPKSVGGDVLAIPVDCSWESLAEEFPDDPGVSIEGKDTEFIAAQLTLIADRLTSHLLGRFRVVDSNVLVVEGEIVTAEEHRIQLDGPHVLVLAPAA